MKRIVAAFKLWVTALEQKRNADLYACVCLLIYSRQYSTQEVVESLLRLLLIPYTHIRIFQMWLYRGTVYILTLMFEVWQANGQQLWQITNIVSKSCPTQAGPSGYPNPTRYPVFHSIPDPTRFSFENHRVAGNPKYRVLPNSGWHNLWGYRWT